MKIIKEDKVINLDKFDSVQYRESLFGAENGFPVEAIKHEQSGGIFGGNTTVSEEIARFITEDLAKALVQAIFDKWTDDCKGFNVGEWMKESNIDSIEVES